MKILITGCAGFIGSHLTDRLISEGHDVVGVDNFNNYYDPKIKEQNINTATRSKNFKLYREDILNYPALLRIIKGEKISKLVHLAARAGIRSSIADPLLYARVNVLGTVNLLNASVKCGISQFIFGSSSSVYGNSPSIPFAEDDPCQNIISPYAASKRSAEFFVENFAKNNKLKSVIVRLFTVYGERGRPDMAPAIFTKAVLNQRPLNQFGDGSSSRDYTYVGDIVDAIAKVLEKSFAYEIINLGNNKPTTLKDFIRLVEKVVGENANINVVSKQMGDVEKTWANIAKANRLLSWKPRTDLEEGLARYVTWLGKD